MNWSLLNLSLVLVAIPFIQCQSEFGVDWTYKDQGDWPKKWEACGRRKQSPINIKPAKEDMSKYSQIMSGNLHDTFPDRRLNMSSYDTPRNVIFKNSGGSAEAQLDNNNGAPMVIYVGKDAVPYVFEKMNIHWGGSSHGSEHSLYGRYQRAELQFVHFNEKYKTFEVAKDKSDGLAVMALLLERSNDYNKALAPLIGKTAQINEYGSQIKVNNFNLGKLLPRNRNLLFIYEGSLTTPPCSETVTWFVFIQHYIIGEKQINNLRQLRDRSGEQITSNRRKIQPINDRVIGLYVERETLK